MSQKESLKAEKSVSTPRQMIFSLSREDHSIEYLIPHSGLAQADEAFSQVLHLLISGDRQFCLFFLWGSKGFGKTHFIDAKLKESKDSLDKDFAVSRFVVSSDDANSDEWIRLFIDTYEKLRAAGGLLIVEAEIPAHQLTSNPHLLSRLLNGVSAEILPPKEGELEPIIRSILERKNLRLTDKVVDYLLRRVPRDFLSFQKILATISDISLSEGRPARLGVVRELLPQVLDDEKADS